MKLYTYEDIYKAIYDYIEWFYNSIRIHSSIGIYLQMDLKKISALADTLYKSGQKFDKFPQKN